MHLILSIYFHFLFFFQISLQQAFPNTLFALDAFPFFMHTFFLYALIIFNILIYSPDFEKTNTFTDEDGNNVGCMSNCYRCTSMDTCEICSQGFFFNEILRICQKCPGNLINRCQECISSYSWSNPNLYEYAFFCNFGTMNTSYYLDEGGDLSQCAQECFLCQDADQCIVCSDGYYKTWSISGGQNTQNCLPCVSPSLECSLYLQVHGTNLDKIGIVYSDFLDYNDFLNKTVLLSESCINDSYILDENFECITPTSISNCSFYSFSDSTGNHFSSALIAFLFSQNSSSFKSLLSLYSLKCSRCQSGYYSSGPITCSQCMESCSQCSEPTECIQCDDDAYFTSSGSCVKCSTIDPSCSKCGYAFYNSTKSDLSHMMNTYSSSFPTIYCFSCIQGFGIIKQAGGNISTPFTTCQKCQNCRACFFMADTTSELCLECIRDDSDSTSIALMNLDTFNCQILLKATLNSSFLNFDKCLQAGTFQNITLPYFCMRCVEGFTPTFNLGCFDCAGSSCFERRASYISINSSQMFFMNFSEVLSNVETFIDYGYLYTDLQADTYIVLYNTVVTTLLCDSYVNPSSTTPFTYSCNSNCLQCCSLCDSSNNNQCLCCGQLKDCSGTVDGSILQISNATDIKTNYMMPKNFTNQTNSSSTDSQTQSTKNTEITSGAGVILWSSDSYTNFSSLIYQVIYVASLSDQTLEANFNGTSLNRLKDIQSVLQNATPSYYNSIDPIIYLNYSKAMAYVPTYLSGIGTASQTCLACRPGCMSCYQQQTDYYSSNYINDYTAFIKTYQNVNCSYCASELLTYDFDRQTCRFCPKGYGNCKAKLKQTIILDPKANITTPNFQSNRTVIVGSMNELVASLQYYTSPQAFYTFFEFYLEEMEVKLLFPSDSESVLQPINDDIGFLSPFYLTLLGLKSSTSINTLNVLLGSFFVDPTTGNYVESANGENKATIKYRNYSQLFFLELDYLEIRNLKFLIDESTYTTINVVSTSDVLHVAIFDVDVSSYQTVPGIVNNGLVNNVFSLLDALTINVNSLSISNLSIISAASLLEFACYIDFNIQGLKLSDSILDNSQTSTGVFIVVSAISPSISDFFISNCSFNNINIIFSYVSGFSVSEVIFIDSSFYQSFFISVQMEDYMTYLYFFPLVSIQNLQLINNLFQSNENSPKQFFFIGICFTSIDGLISNNNTFSSFSLIILDASLINSVTFSNMLISNSLLNYSSKDQLGLSAKSLIHVINSGIDQDIFFENVTILMTNEPLYFSLSQSLIYFQNINSLNMRNLSFLFNLAQIDSAASSDFNYFQFIGISVLLLQEFRFTGSVFPGFDSSLSNFMKVQQFKTIEISNWTVAGFQVKNSFIYIDNQLFMDDSTIFINSCFFDSTYIIASQTSGSLLVLTSVGTKERISFYISNSTFLNCSIYPNLRPSIMFSNAYVSKISFENSIFKGNLGGLFSIGSEEIIFESCLFSKMETNDSSYVIGSLQFINIRIAQSVFQNISSTIFYLFNLQIMSNIVLESLFFNNVSSSDSGSAFYVDSGINAVTTIKAENIEMTRSFCINNGVLFLFAGRGKFSLNMNRLFFTKSYSGQVGTVFFIDLASFFNCTITNTVVTDLTKVTAISIKMTINVICFFSNVTASLLSESSLFLEMFAGTLVFSQCSFMENEYGDSGLINLQEINLFSIFRSSFTMNSFYNPSSDGIIVERYDIDLSAYLKLKNNNIYINSLIVAINSNIKITTSIFESNDCPTCSGGVLAFIGNKYFFLNITNSTFRNNSAFAGGAMYLYNSFSTNIQSQIVDCQFIDNIAFFGGGIYLAYVQLIMTNTVFINNIAHNILNDASSQSLGGGILYEADLTTTNVLTLSQVSFNNCQAGIGGGVYISGKEYLTDDNSQIYYYNNSASSHGKNCYSFPSAIKILNATGDFYFDGDSGNFHSFKPGGQIENLTLAMIDEDGRVISIFESEPNIQFIFNCTGKNETYSNCSSAKTRNIQRNDASQSLFFLMNLTLNGNFTINYSITLSSSLTIPNSNNCVKYSNPTIPVSFRRCVIGEVTQEQSCSLCVGMYSFSSMTTQCNECESQTMQRCIGNKIYIKPGYWRRALDSDNIQACNIPGICLGDDLTEEIQSNNTCYRGHIGALCQACDTYGTFWNDTYYSFSDNICNKCSEINYSTIMFVILLIFNIAIMAIVAKGALEMIEIEQKFEVIGSKEYVCARSQAINKQIYVKIIINYFQIITVITHLQLNLPTFLRIIPQSIGNPSGFLLHSGDCYISQIFSSIPLVYCRAAIITALPFLYVSCYAIIYLLATVIGKTKTKLQIFYSITLFSLIYLQPNVVNTMIELVTCLQITDRKYIKADFAYKCYTREHFLYIFSVFMPTLLIWIVVFPFVLFALVYRQRTKLDSFPVKLKYGFLVNEYKNKAYYWEFVKVFEKIAILFCLNFFENEIMSKGLLILMIIFIYSFLLIVIQPYKTLEIQKIDSTSCFVCYFTIFFGLFAYGNPTSKTCQLISYVIISFLNVYFVILLLYKLLGKFMHDNQRLKSFLIDKIPFSKRFLKLGKSLSVIHNWKKVQNFVVTYSQELKRKRKKKELSLKSQEYEVRTELDEDILEQLRKSATNEVNLVDSEVFKFSEIEEKKEPLSPPKYFFEMESPVSIIKSHGERTLLNQ